MNRITIALFVVFTFCSYAVTAQKNVTTAGFQIKPIFKNNFLRTADKIFAEEGVDFKVGNQSGFAAGMVVRHGISNRFSFETGINYIKRNYRLNITDSAFSSTSDFKIVGYEIPAMGMVFIPLSRNIHMNVSMGLSLDIFPSDIFTGDDNFKHYSLRKHVVNSGIQTNLGWEFRTEESGWIYLGASYHRPFEHIYFSQIAYEINSDKTIASTTLDGSYFTVDLRYFFHSDPITKKKK